MAEDLPELVEDFLEEKDELLCKRARAVLNRRGLIFARKVDLSN